MLYICSRQVKVLALSLIFILFAITMHAQRGYNRGSNPNFNKFQQKPFYYGIALGYNSAFFNVSRSRSFIGNPDYDVVESINGPGFGVGVIGNLKIGRFFDLRTVVNFAIMSRTMTYQQANSMTLDKQRLSSSIIEVPFLLRFKSAPYKDKRVFVLTGFKYAYDASNNANTDTEDFQLNISPHDFQFEVGAGVQFFLPFFILSPELKFSQGLGNILIYDQTTDKSRIIDRILSRSISFTLNFEG